MESSHGSGACGIGLIVHKGAVALRDQKHAFDVVGGVTREVIFEVDNVGTRGQVSNP